MRRPAIRPPRPSAPLLVPVVPVRPVASDFDGRAFGLGAAVELVDPFGRGLGRFGFVTMLGHKGPRFHAVAVTTPEVVTHRGAHQVRTRA